TDPRYSGEPIPRTECLEQVLERLLPYWDQEIVPELKSGKTVMVAAHGNSLRAIVKHLDQISDEDISGLNIPTGVPLYYELDENLQPVKKGGTYLDPDAEAKIAAVANQGK
ncbi:MAG: 2,3-bisphosphoglycerate-dependent phosphoglycerate mutase, partial [Varibaculum cambriense]|nr:2,3-bisphosphoglycerate-dependent phosphoglycerate mutase [Varibaculum cambriense]